jgi:hypothetical protein
MRKQRSFVDRVADGLQIAKEDLAIM